MKNNRTFLEKLLDGAEVEWKTLDEVFHLKNGYTPSKGIKEYWENGSIPWFRMEDIRENGRVLNTSLQKVSEGAVKGGKLFPANSIILSTTATIGEHALVKVEHLSNQQLTNFSIKESFLKYLDIKFAFHYFFLIGNQIKKSANFSSLPIVSLKDLKKIQIPIPPLPVQTEIVRILDALTALTSELTSELILRRKQYEYYREKLLSEEELIKLGVTTENLGNITSITSGGTPSTKEPAYWVEGNIPWIKSESCKNKLIDEIKHHITEMGLQNSNAKLLSPNTTLMAMVGATIFKTAFLPFEATTNQNIAAIKSKNELSITDKFIFYYLTNMYDFFISKLSGYNMVNLSQIKNIKILLPPLEEQQRIVSILDKFEALTNSITEGLPLAIEQNQKRYEYYRELLLNFS